MKRCPSGCSCSSRWSSPGRSDRRTGAICCAREAGRRARARRRARHARRRAERRRRGPRAARILRSARPLAQARRGRPATPEPAPVADRAGDDHRPGLALGRAPGAGVARRTSTASARSRAAVGGAQPRASLPPHRLGRPLRRTRSRPAQALVIRAGWGEGEQVAVRALAARARAAAGARRRAAAGARDGARRADRSAALRPQERLAELLGARGASAAVRGARAARAPGPRPRAPRARRDRARPRLRGGAAPSCAPSGARTSRSASPSSSSCARGGRRAGAAPALPGEPTAQPDEEVVRHALERLEAALRARTATGFSLR